MQGGKQGEGDELMMGVVHGLLLQDVFGCWGHGCEFGCWGV